MSADETAESGPSRRDFLRATGAAVGAASLSGCLDVLLGPQGGSGRQTPGAEMTYRQDIAREDADLYVTSVDELAQAIQQNNGGSSTTIIWIEPGEYDLSGRSFEIESIILAGGRGEESEGPLLLTTDRGENSPAYRGGTGNGVLTLLANSRITGIRLQGPAWGNFDHEAYRGFIPYPSFDLPKPQRMQFYATWHARAITILGEACSIDNCEIFGWPTQGVVIGSSNHAPSPEIAFCFIHNNMMGSAGYGTDCKRGHPFIYRCYFDCHRHDVNGYGHADCSYTVSECSFGPHASDHRIDMHRLEDNQDRLSNNPDSDIYRYRAGQTITVERSTFAGTEIIPDARRSGTNEWVHIRGIPADGCYLIDNAVEWDGPSDNGIPINQTGIPSNRSTDDRGFINIIEEGTEYNADVSDAGPGALGTDESGGGRGRGRGRGRGGQSAGGAGGSGSSGGRQPPSTDVSVPEDATTIRPGESVVDVLENASAGESYELASGTHQASRRIMLETDGITVVVPEEATLRAPDGISEGESFINVRASDITLLGNGVLEGNAENSNGLGADPPSSHGHEHIVHVGHHSIDWISGFLLDGLTIQNAPGGDGIYANQAEGVRLQNFTVDAAYRNGLSCTDVQNVVIDNFLVRDTSGTAPGAGVAFEPNSEGETIDGVTVSNGETRNNSSHGLYVNNHFTDQQQGSSTIDIEIENVDAIGNGLYGFSLHGTSGAERIRLTNCTARSTAEAGIYVGGSGNVQIVDCEAIGNGQNQEGDNHEVGIAVDIDEGNGEPGDVVARNFTARDEDGTQKHPGAALKGSTLRVIGASVGSHTFDQNGFRAHGSGSRIEHAKVEVEGGPPAFATSGGTVTDAEP